MYRIRIIPILAILTLAGSLQPFPRAEATELEEFLERALTRNPELEALEEGIEAERYRAAVTGGFPDPTLSYSYFIDEIETRLGPQQSVIQLVQPLPFPGKLSLMEEIAGYDALVAEQSLNFARLSVAKQVKVAFYSIAAIDEALGVIEDERSLLGRLEETISIRLETGGAHQQDLLKIQIERLKLEERRLAYAKRRVSLAAELNALADLESDSPVSIDSPPYRGYIAESLEELRRSASSQPELRSAQYRIDQGNRSLALARKKYYPDFTIGMSYFDIRQAPVDVPDSGRDAWNVTIGVRLPIWFGKTRNETRQQRSGIRLLEREYESARSRIMADIEDLYNQYLIAVDLVSMYRDELLPRAEQALLAAEGTYMTGEIDIVSLLDSERLLLGLKISLAERRAEVEIRIAELETVVGRELTRSE